MTWNYREGLLSANTKTFAAQSLATHNGHMWVAYTGTDGVIKWARGTNDSWEDEQAFSVNGVEIKSSTDIPPKLVEFKGELYALIAPPNEPNDYSIFHRNDQEQAWQLLSYAFTSRPSPALLQYAGKLFCVGVNVQDNGLKFWKWDGPGGNGWSPPKPVNESSWGYSSLFTLNGNLYLAFEENNSERKIRICVYDPLTDGFSRAPNPVGSIAEAAAYGLCTASGNNQAYIAFLQNDGSGYIIIDGNSGTSWGRGPNPDQYTHSTPTMTILDGVLNMAWNSHNDSWYILWAQRPTISAPTDGWMTALNDATLVSNLSIPGTHDSSSFNFELLPFVRTQTMDFQRQLNAGIRYLDLRCTLRENVIEMVHGDIYLGFTLDSVFKTLYSWLDDHPREGLVVQIKHDGDDESSTKPLYEAINELISKDSKYWRTSNTTPNLGDIRGKMQLMRRYSGEGLEGFGINVADGWRDDFQGVFEITTNAGVVLSIQDHYTPGSSEDIRTLIDEKYKYSKQLLDAATSSTDATHWFINFTSGYEANVQYLFQAREVAVGRWSFGHVEGVNGLMRENLRLRSLGVQRMGVFMMDYPEAPNSDYIAEIIQSNF